MCLCFTAHCLLYQVHPVLPDPRRAIHRQRADQKREILDPGHSPRDQPEAGHQAFENDRR